MRFGGDENLLDVLVNGRVVIDDEQPLPGLAGKVFHRRSAVRIRDGEFQGERGALAGAVAVDGQGAAEFLRGERAAVQAEAVAGLFAW